MIRLVNVILFILFIPAFSAAAEEPFPELKLDQAVAKLKPKLQIVAVEHDPVYRAPKSYRAFPLADLLETLKLPKSLNANDAVIVFTSVDGYKVSMAYQDALRAHGYIAVSDVAAPDNQSWTRFKFGKQSMTPAPYYLVWTAKGLDEWRYPWPFQMAEISVQSAQSYFGAAAPEGGGQSVERGFYLFSRYCIRCHSVNLAGGEVGPELNIPQNITEYFKEEAIAGFILNATAFRAGTKMPVFENLLSNDDARAIVSYLKRMRSEKKQ